MALKNVLNISVILLPQIILLGCSSVSKNKTNLVDKPKTNIMNNDATDSLIIKENKDTLTIDLAVDTSNSNSINIKEDKKTATIIKDTVVKKITVSDDKKIIGKPVKAGTGFILFPQARINDSINLFVDNYARLMRTLMKKGVSSPIERDSLLWEEWQIIVSKNDSTHKKVEYSRDMVFGSKKE